MRFIWAVVAVACLSCGLVSWKRECRVYRCWNLTPVVVAAHRIEPGARLTYEDLSQRSFPEQYVRAADVKPDLAGAIVGQFARWPLNEGEPIQWTDLQANRDDHRPAAAEGSDG
jgi:Flp pilus assembly protein CpaB